MARRIKPDKRVQFPPAPPRSSAHFAENPSRRNVGGGFFKKAKAMNSQEVLYNLKVALVETLPLHYTIPGYAITNVVFRDNDTREDYEFQYEPVKGATTILQMYVNGSHIRGFENAEQVVSYFYAKESAK